MAKHYLSEEQVKQALHIGSFRELSKDKIMEFVSLIPNMDKEVAMSIINQFPTYADSAKTMVEQMNAMCENILADNKDSRQLAVSAYYKILESLQNRLENPQISDSERKDITETMIDIAEKIAAKDTENKQFLTGLFKYGSMLIGGVVVIGAAILGVQVKGTQIPSLNKA